MIAHNLINRRAVCMTETKKKCPSRDRREQNRKFTNEMCDHKKGASPIYDLFEAGVHIKVSLLPWLDWNETM